MRSRFTSGIVAGSILGATVGMYAATKMSPRQRRRMMKAGKKIILGTIDNMGMF